MSGLMRPSIVGPRELNGSSALFCQQIAPAAKVCGDLGLETGGTAPL